MLFLILQLLFLFVTPWGIIIISENYIILKYIKNQIIWSGNLHMYQYWCEDSCDVRIGSKFEMGWYRFWADTDSDIDSVNIIGDWQL